jgi:hypothetical protein
MLHAVVDGVVARVDGVVAGLDGVVGVVPDPALPHAARVIGNAISSAPISRVRLVFIPCDVIIYEMIRSAG